MSFILDALRKSEHERQRQAGPAIAELPMARSGSRIPIALIAVGALLAINLVVVLYWLLKNDAPEVVRETALAEVAVLPASPAVALPPPAAQATRPAPVREREIRSLAEEVSAGPPPDDAPPAPPDPSLLPAYPTTATPVAGPSRQQPVSVDSVPRIDTLPPQATAGLPSLNLDLHIYSTDPAQRAAFINGRRYRTGDTLPEGIEITSITPEGVVLRHRGQQFLLPRQ